MTRDGLTEQNQTTGESERISKRIQEADFQKTPEQQAAQDAAQLQGAASPSSPLSHAPGTAPKQDTAAAERVMERIDAAHTARQQKSGKESTGGSGGTNEVVPLAVYRRRTFHPGTGKIH